MLGLSAHRHSATFLPHRHTSYRGLGVVLGLAAALITLLTVGLVAPGNAGTLQSSSSIGVTASVPGPPPSTSPVITSPPDGSTVTVRQLTVSGSCSGDFTIVVTSNGVVRGSAFCDHSDTFSLIISLDVGANQLAAHYVDNLNQSGPPSAIVLVTYKPGGVAPPLASASPKVITPNSSSSPAAASPLTVTAPPRFDNIQPGDTLTLTGDIEGGAAPYALEIDWGDGTQTLLSRSPAGGFSQEHTYSKAGRYVIRLNVSDAAGATAQFQTTLTVTGAATSAPTQPSNPPLVAPPIELMVIWPIFLVTCLVVLSFWLGERYDRRHFPSLPPAA